MNEYGKQTVVGDSKLDYDTVEKLSEFLATQSKPISQYEMAINAMDNELIKKGLPKMKVLLELLEEHHPEYFL